MFPPQKNQPLPHKHTEITYFAKVQYANKSTPIQDFDKSGIKIIQGIFGALLYYTHDVDNKPLVSLSEIVSEQDAATEYTAAVVSQLLDYISTYPNDGITYCASSMVVDGSRVKLILTSVSFCRPLPINHPFLIILENKTFLALIKVSINETYICYRPDTMGQERMDTWRRHSFAPIPLL